MKLLWKAFFVALVTAAVGSAIWTVITALSGYKTVFFALGIGGLVGLAVSWVAASGPGARASLNPALSLMAGLVALFGCVLGTVLIIIWFVAFDHQLSFVAAAQKNSISWVIGVFIETFVLIDAVVFGACALLAARLAMHRA